jgi:hypothetical protein
MSNILTPICPSYWALFVVLSVLATLEIIIWYKFWRWFFISYLPRKKEIRKTIEFAKEISGELKRDGYIERLKSDGYIDRVIYRCEEIFRWATHSESWHFKKIKAWGHLGLFILGVEPFFSGGRIAGVIFCSTLGWSKGLYSLCIGNIFHVAITVGFWKYFHEFVGYLWSLL